MTPTPSPPRNRSLFWPLQLGGWGLFGAAMFIAGASQWTLSYAAAVKSSLTLSGFVTSLVLRAVYRAAEKRGLPMPALAAAALPLSYGAAGLWMASHNFAVTAYRKGAGTALAAFPDFVNTIYFFFLLLAWSFLYFGIPAFRQLAMERERVAQAQRRAHEARLAALRLQLNPHFLFNALNAVSTLIAESRGPEANRMLTRLAAFLRATLDREAAAEVSIREEVAFARRYLDIEQERFGERLRVEIAVEPAAEVALIPTLLLQPLVENAVRHAVAARVEGGAIAILAARLDGFVDVGVRDDGPGASAGAREGRGIGLANTRERLQELYGDSATLTAAEALGGGFAVSVRLPFRAAP